MLRQTQKLTQPIADEAEEAQKNRQDPKARQPCQNKHPAVKHEQKARPLSRPPVLIGLIFWRLSSHSLLGISVEPTRPKAWRTVSRTVEINPPLPKVRPGWIMILIVQSCRRNSLSVLGCDGKKFLRSPSGWSVNPFVYVWLAS